MIERKRSLLPSGDLSDVEEDVIEDLEESIKEIEAFRRPRRKKKLRYPSSRDVYEAVKEAARNVSPEISPADFPDIVREVLRLRGFYTGLVSDKRIWRAYRVLVAKRSIPDVLGIMG
jgi:hypothetical protein